MSQSGAEEADGSLAESSHFRCNPESHCHPANSQVTVPYPFSRNNFIPCSHSKTTGAGLGAGLGAGQLAQGRQRSQPHQPGPVSTNPRICTSAADKELAADLTSKAVSLRLREKPRKVQSKIGGRESESDTNSDTKSDGRSHWPLLPISKPLVCVKPEVRSHLLKFLSCKIQLGLACGQMHMEKP